MSQQCEHIGDHPAGPAKLSGRCSFFRGILPAKVWKLLSHIHMVNRFRDSFLRKTFHFLTADDTTWRGSRNHTSMTEHVKHGVTYTLTIAFILLALPPPFVSLTLRLSFCSALSQPHREGSEEAERDKNNWSVSLALLLSVCSSLPPLPASRLTPVSGMSWPWVRGVPAPWVSAKPIDPLTTYCFTSFREEQVCTCEIWMHTEGHIFTPRSFTVYSNMRNVLTEVFALTSSP